ncbi:Ribosome biogenesis protein WDR12-like [Heracleum sosnowskyi]|uniref:Ribosome biogenesis protein WDR12 homolog n=1 Tax=Heracleum sosnowskyi TaxID=360622 RepID=A0AAD8MSM9_9APIA|nr:Ribosome biogenesis protein WDR12-like [Heracleum sosnowskyi]
MDAMDIEEEEMSRQVQVRFVTKLKAPLKAPNTTIAIPSNLTRMGLSTLVNTLLQSSASEEDAADWKHEAFDFLIQGELVRMALGQFLLAKGITAEKVLEIEYIKAVIPRKEEEPSLHDDWVSAVDGSNPGFILTGCYDGLGRVWKSAGTCTHILEGHNDAITSVSIVNPKGVESSNDMHVATASKDKTIKLWKFDAEDTLDHPMNIRSFRTLRGHNASVQTIAGQASGDMLCSGSWDCRIKLWQTKASESGGDSVSIKKRKTGGENEESQSEGEAVSTFVGHTQCVSSVVWPEYDTIYSASWDHSIRRWDVEAGKDTLNIFCGKVINSIDVGGEGSALIAAGGSDPILRIWDPRKPGTLAPVFQFSSHSSWISTCKWHDKSWFHLLSASYDGKLMLWDLRTAWPLAVIDSHEDKVLCADWWKGDCVVSGGVDSKLRVSSEISVQ